MVASGNRPGVVITRGECVRMGDLEILKFHTPESRTNIKFHSTGSLRIDDEPSLLKEGPVWPTSSWACKAKERSRTNPLPTSFSDHRAPSRITKSRIKPKVLDKNLLAKYSLYSEISGVTAASSTATSHAGITEPATSAFPSSVSGLQDETVFGPQASWPEVGLPSHSGTDCTLDMNIDPPSTIEAPQCPLLPNQNQFPYSWTWGHFNDPPPTEPVSAAWEGAGLPYISPEACALVNYTDGTISASSLPYGDPSSYLNVVNHPYSFVPAQAGIPGTVEATSYQMPYDGDNPFVLPIRGIENCMETSGTAGQWVMVDATGGIQETSDVEEKEVPPCHAADGTPSPPLGDQSPDDPVMTPEIDSSETSPEDGSSEGSPGDESDSPVVKSETRKPKARRPLEEDKRRQTSATRKLKACIRCRMQKIRVSIMLNILTSFHPLRSRLLLTGTSSSANIVRGRQREPIRRSVSTMPSRVPEEYEESDPSPPLPPVYTRRGDNMSG